MNVNETCHSGASVVLPIALTLVLIVVALVYLRGWYQLRALHIW